MNLINLIIENNKSHYNQNAVCFKKNGKWRDYTWSKLLNKVGQTANALINSDVKTNDNVGIFASNMLEWFIFDLAIMKIGAVSVPIYSTNTADQAKFILDDTATKVILVGDQKQYNTILEVYSESKFLETIVVVKDEIRLETDHSFHFNSWISKQSTKIKTVDKDDNDLLTIIYTSGTTGIPKGVMLTHKNLITVIKSHKEVLKFDNLRGENSLCFLPLSHIFERGWSLVVLYLGGKITILENPREVAETMMEIKPTMMTSVPRLYQKAYSAITEKIKESSFTTRKLFSWAISIGSKYADLKRNEKEIPFLLNLKYKFANKFIYKQVKAQFGGKLWFMPVGGASLDPEIIKLFDSIGIHLTIGYGLTETSATVCLFPATKYQYNSVGKPMIGVDIKIGENNEIMVKGNNITIGYYKKPEETAKSFEGEWFKTGDAGYITDDGSLVMVERIKDLMKTSNGKYIAPQMVENTLTNDNYIQQVIVIGDNKPFVTALLVPNFEALKGYAKKLDISYDSLEDLIKLDKVKVFYQERVKDLQKNLANYEQVKKFELLSKEFSMETGEITPTLKVRRKVILEKYADIINNIYNNK